MFQGAYVARGRLVSYERTPGKRMSLYPALLRMAWIVFLNDRSTSPPRQSDHIGTCLAGSPASIIVVVCWLTRCVMFSAMPDALGLLAAKLRRLTWEKVRRHARRAISHSVEE